MIETQCKKEGTVVHEREEKSLHIGNNICRKVTKIVKDRVLGLSLSRFVFQEFVFQEFVFQEFAFQVFVFQEFVFQEFVFQSLSFNSFSLRSLSF